MTRQALMLLSLASAIAAGVVVGATGASGGDDVRTHIQQERARLRAHFDSVLVELRSRDVSDLSAPQRAARVQLTSWLAEYRDAGRFPLNDRHAASPTPIFRDARAVTCAMAYLIERSGRGDIVDSVAESRNLAYIAELAGDSGLVAWLDSVGLEASEAARVQPTYGPAPATTHDFTVEAIWGGASVGMTVLNLVRPGRAQGALGTLVGGVTMLVGVAAVRHSEGRDRSDERAVGRVTVGVGGAALLTGLWRLSQKGSTSSNAESVAESRNTSIVLVPVVGLSPGVRALTLGLRGRF